MFGGDFRQIPPIVRNGSREHVGTSSLKRSPIWRTMRRHVLTRNLRRLEGGGGFADYLIKIRDGSVAILDGEDTIELPSEICTGATLLDDPFGAIEKQVFPDIGVRCGDEDYLFSGAVLSSRHADVARVNDTVFRMFKGEEFELKSANSAARGGEAGLYQVEFLNSLDISGPPPHTIRLKVGMPSMPLMHLNAEHGMCNGSKSIVGGIRPMCVEVEVYTWKFSGSREFAHSLPLHPSDTDLPFKLVRYKFPLRPCVAISMYKSQGKTLQRV